MIIMANDIKYQINVQIADNTVTKDDTDDKIFVIVSLGTADKERIIAEMMDMNPGVEPEMMRLVLDLEKRAVKRLLLNGMRVNNGLFEAVPQCRGLVRGTAWDPEANEIYVNFTQGKELREAIADVVVNVIGEKGAAMYLSSSLDAATGLGLFNATAGANLTLTGKNIKVVGDDPSVGITLTDSEGAQGGGRRPVGRHHPDRQRGRRDPDQGGRHRPQPAFEADLPRPRHPRRRRLYAHHHDAVQRRLPTEDTEIRLPDH